MAVCGTARAETINKFTGSRPGVGVGVCEVLDAFLAAGGSLLRDFVAHWDSDIRWFGLQEGSDARLALSQPELKPRVSSLRPETCPIGQVDQRCSMRAQARRKAF